MYGLFGWANVTGYAKGVGGLFEAFAGASLGFATSWTGVGAVAGGAVALHGIDTAIAGFRQGYSGKVVDSFTSKGLQTAGVSRGTANLIDAGISVAGSVGTGVVRGGIRAAAVASSDEAAAAGLKGFQALSAYEKGSMALVDDVYNALGAASTSPIYKSAFVGNQSLNLGKAVSLYSKGLTPLAEIGAGTFGAGLTGVSGVYNYNETRK